MWFPHSNRIISNETSDMGAEMREIKKAFVRGFDRDNMDQTEG